MEQSSTAGLEGAPYGVDSTWQGFVNEMPFRWERRSASSLSATLESYVCGRLLKLNPGLRSLESFKEHGRKHVSNPQRDGWERKSEKGRQKVRNEGGRRWGLYGRGQWLRCGLQAELVKSPTNL